MQFNIYKSYVGTVSTCLKTSRWVCLFRFGSIEYAIEWDAFYQLNLSFMFHFFIPLYEWIKRFGTTVNWWALVRANFHVFFSLPWLLASKSTMVSYPFWGSIIMKYELYISLMKHEKYYENWWNMKYIMKIDEISPKVVSLGSRFLLIW